MSHFPGVKKIQSSSHHLLAMEGQCPTSTEKWGCLHAEVNHLGMWAWLPAKIQGPLKKVIVGWLEMLPKKYKAIILDYYGNMGGGGNHWVGHQRTSVLVVIPDFSYVLLST